MSGVSPSLNTNPNAKGGSFNYDSRTGLGYGQTTNGGLGSNWSMGDALSSPKGEWDNELPINMSPSEIVIGPDTTVEELAIAAGIIEIEDEEITDVEAGVNSKANTSFHMPTVDFAAKKKRNPNSYVGLANTSAYLGASHKRSGEVVLERYIREILLENTTISARQYVQYSLGDPYKPSTANAIGGTHGAIGGESGAEDFDGYSQKAVELDKDLYPYANTMTLKGSTDGRVHTAKSSNVSDEMLGQEEDLDFYGDDKSMYRSSAEIMLSQFDEEAEAESYVNRHRKKRKF
jgi:hypothetical protein